MAALMSSRLSSLTFTAFKHRGVTSAAIRFTHSLLVRKESNSNFIHRRTVPVTIKQVAQIQQVESVQEPKSNPVEYLDLCIRLKGFVDIASLRKCIKELKCHDSVTSKDGVTLIRSVGECLRGNGLTPRVRWSITKEVWAIVQEKVEGGLAIQHFDALMNTYLENDEKFVPEDILSQIKERNLQLSKASYQSLIRYYCSESELDRAQNLMEEYFKAGHPQELRLYNSLLIAYTNLNDQEAINVILKTMSEAGIEFNTETCTILLSHYVRTGDVDRFEETFQVAKSIETEGFSPYEIFKIIKPLLECGDERKSEDVIFDLKKLVTDHVKQDLFDIKKKNVDLCENAFPNVYNTLKKNFIPGLTKARILHYLEKEQETEQPKQSYHKSERPVKYNLYDELIDAYEAKDYKKVERKKKILERYGDIRQLDILSKLICMYIDLKDEENLENYWHLFLRRGKEICKSQVVDRPLLSSVDRKHILEPICLYVEMLLKTDQFETAIMRLREASKNISLNKFEGALPVDFNSMLYNCFEVFGVQKTCSIVTQLRTLANSSALERRFVAFLAEHNLDYALMYFKHSAAKKNFFVGLRNIFIESLKQNRIQDMNNLVSYLLKEKVHVCSSSVVLQDLFLAYICTGMKEKARSLVEVEGFKFVEKHFQATVYSFYKNDKMRKELEDIVEVAGYKMSSETIGKILSYIANLYVQEKNFDAAAAVLKRLDEEDLYMETLIIDKTLRAFVENNKKEPVLKHNKWSERDSVGILVDKIRKAGVQQNDMVIKIVSKKQPKKLYDAILKLSEFKDFHEMETLASYISYAGGVDLLLTLFSKLKLKLNPRALLKWRESIPYAYYHDSDMQTYITMLEENKEFDSLLSPAFLTMVQKSSPKWIQSLSDLADKESCMRRHEITNALWAAYCEINIDVAKTFIKKIPKEYSLKHMFSAFEGVKEHQKDRIGEFWPMIQEHVSLRSKGAQELKRLLLYFYYKEDMLDKMLAEFDFCLEHKIPVHRGTLTLINVLCTKHNRPVPENVKYFTEPEDHNPYQEEEMSDRTVLKENTHDNDKKIENS